MNVLEKLDARIRELDGKVKRSLGHDYNFRAAEDRELLEAAAARIRELEATADHPRNRLSNMVMR